MGLEILTIMQDRRPIDYISGEDGCSVFYRVGHQGITSIRPYSENGEMAPVTWFAVYAGDTIRVRVPARFTEVVYAEEDAPDEH